MTTSREVDLPPYRFWETRAGSGTPVVLIHGLGGSADWWRRNIDALAREHLVVAVDLVGFGRNRLFLRRSALPLSFGSVAALLARWIESSFTGPVHLVGNSMGGQIAIHVAATRPDLVRSLTLVNATGIPFELAPGRHIENLILPRGAYSFSTILARDAFRSGPASIALAFARLLRDDARPLLRRIRVPVLLVWGSHDPLVPLTYARQFNELVPQARLVEIPNAAHIPMWENAEAFNRELLAFLREVDALPIATYPVPDAFSWPVSGAEKNIVYRESGTRRDVVLIHGIGMTSAYFVHFARALFERGLHSIAPDLPGFGESPDARSASPEEHARRLVEWADALEVRDALWVGHSLGCNVVAHVARMRPDLVHAPVHVGPLWTKSRHPMIRLFGCLPLDAFREPFSLYTYVIPAYWRCGLGRWWLTFRRSFADIRTDLPPGTMIAGERDPIPDTATVRDITRTPGAHACLFSDPAEVAEAIVGERASRPQSPAVTAGDSKD
ncbi:MAG TPA: alpha/beta fold hydrolase [Thermoanaerobaculia bacterium]